MVLLAYGMDVPNDQIRSIADSLQGTTGYNDGIALQYLQAIARQAGLQTEGLVDANNQFHQWSMADVIREIRLGYPVMTLVHYASLPTHAMSGSTSDHFIVVVGLSSNGFIVNDPASFRSEGFQQELRPDDLLRAWRNASIPNQAVAFLPPVGQGGLKALTNLAAPPTETPAPTVQPTTTDQPPDPPTPVAVAGDQKMKESVSLPPPNPALIDWSNRVRAWGRASLLPTVVPRLSSDNDTSSVTGALVLADHGTTAPSPWPIIAIVGLLAVAGAAILQAPRRSKERRRYVAAGRSRGRTIPEASTRPRYVIRDVKRPPPP